MLIISGISHRDGSHEGGIILQQLLLHRRRQLQILPPLGVLQSAAVGADAALVVTPYYNKATPQGLTEHYRALCASVHIPVIAYNVLKSQSDGRIVVRLEVVKKVAMTLVLVYTIPRGVVAIAWGVVAMALLEWAINLVAASRYTALSLAQALGAHLPAVLLSGVMFLGVRLFKQAIGAEFSLFALLSSQILLGVLLYALLALLIRPRALRVLFEVVKGMRGSR